LKTKTKTKSKNVGRKRKGQKRLETKQKKKREEASVIERHPAPTLQSNEVNVHVQEDGGRSQTDTLAQAADHEQSSDNHESLINSDTSWGLFEETESSNIATASLIGSVLRDL